jgi:hypothetical protein
MNAAQSLALGSVIVTDNAPEFRLVDYRKVENRLR